jgi:sialidase-1
MTAVVHEDMLNKIAANLKSGIVFKNPSPHLKSVHAYFPSIVAAPNGKLFVIFTTGEAFESVNLRVRLAISVDSGRSWKMLPDPAPLSADALISETGRLALTSSNELVLVLTRHSRAEHPTLGLVNPTTLGFVSMQFLIVRSNDWGESWTEPQPIVPPLEGPEFEMCGPLPELQDGRLLLPTSTWSDWDGNKINGIRSIAFVSKDHGRTWPEYINIMHHVSDRVHYWESKVIEQRDGVLVAVAWVYDAITGADLPNQYVLSRDGGATWTSPRSTGLQGQTMATLPLKNGQILSAYRRMDRPGLWLNLSHFGADNWVNDATEPLWGHDTPGKARGLNVAQEVRTLRFGAPSLTYDRDGRIFLAFWCYEDCVSVIRWFSFDLDSSSGHS